MPGRGSCDMAIPLLTAKGRPGDWFAELQERVLPEGVQRRLPCVHNEWRDKEDRQQFDDWHAPLEDPKWPEFLAAIQRGQVIETRDTVPEHRQGGWKREKRDPYIAVWAIGPIEIRGGHLLFRFGDRLAHLK